MPSSETCERRVVVGEACVHTRVQMLRSEVEERGVLLRVHEPLVDIEPGA